MELLQIAGQVVHTDLEKRGYFRSSNEVLNKVQNNLQWSFLGNYHGYPTDCPHREKMGWTGDALLVAETGQFNKLRLNGKETSMTKHSDKAGVYLALVLDSGAHLLEF